MVGGGRAVFLFDLYTDTRTYIDLYKVELRTQVLRSFHQSKIRKVIFIVLSTNVTAFKRFDIVHIK